MQAGRSRKLTVRSIGVRCTATLIVLTCAMAVLASPALALTEGFAPWAVCDNNKEGAEVVAREMGPEPANGATVTAGTPVTFSGESNRALTFNVASSPALLSSPDIDSGAGAQSGAFYRFTSTKATATPRTIYWTASFTFTPGDCESPSTFTTPMRTLIVAPSAAEVEATQARQEEEAAKKRMEEEAAAKKKEEEAAAAGGVVLDGATIDVENRRDATVNLTCSDVAACAGKLTLTASVTAGNGKARHARTETIGAASFSIAAGVRVTVKLTLGNAGRERLSAAHGHLSAILTILRVAPLPSKTQTQHVRLVEQRPEGKK